MTNELSVRKPGEILAQVVDDSNSSAVDREADRLLILIHGYENNEARARSSFARFRSSLQREAGAHSGTIGTIWDFHWPGNHPFRPISLVTYSNKIGVARDAGKLLVDDWLANRRPTQEVCIVAHSLGCRVALEAIRKIRDLTEKRRPYVYRGARVGAVFLLAAAVPARLCGATESFGSPAAGSHEYAFFSRSDRVLQGPFLAGQALAAEYGTAVGRDGAPLERWTERKDTSLSHSQYWSSNYVALWVCEFLGIPGFRTLDARLLPSTDLVQDASLLERRTLQSRERPGRQL